MRSLQAEPLNHGDQRRLAESNRCFAPRNAAVAQECGWCGGETVDLQPHPRLDVLVCDDCLAPPKRPEPAKPKLPPRTGWIYFIQAGGAAGPVKIGIAESPHERLIEFQTGNHLTLRLVHRFRGTLREEQELHSSCRAFHVRGEWFKAGVLEHLRVNTPRGCS